MVDTAPWKTLFSDNFSKSGEVLKKYMTGSLLT